MIMIQSRYLINRAPFLLTKSTLRLGKHATKRFEVPLQRFQTHRTMSLIPHTHRGGLSTISRALDNYETMLFNLGGHQAYAPSFDIRETEKSYYLDGDLPGVEQKDLSIEFEDDHCLSIKAHTERESTSEDGSWWASERSVGDFRRTFNFPSSIDQDNTHARLKNGVLSLEVPKATQTHTKKKVEIVD